MNIIYGPPGTGKTTDLLSTMQAELESGVRPQQIAFVSFTKKATEEARERAKVKFGFTDAQLPYFKTVHALAFNQLGLRREDVMGWPHLKELADALGIELKGRGALDDDLYGMSTGDRLMFLEGLARVTGKPLRQVWEEADEIDIDFRELDRFSRALENFKQFRGLTDYTDMLKRFVEKAPAPKLAVLIVDEAQDLSALQWECIDVLRARAERVYIAGDDRQAIYQWAGADVGHFLALNGTRRVLEQSYRIPSAVHRLANTIAGRIVKKSEQIYKPRDEEGAVHWYADAEEVDLSEGPGWKEYRAKHPNAIEWLLLARNGYMLEALEDMCRRRGYSYASVNHNPLDSPALKAILVWESMRRGQGASREAALNVLKYISIHNIGAQTRDEVKKLKHGATVNLSKGMESPDWMTALSKISEQEREWIRSVRRNKETITGVPRIRISTIHASKGGEASNVLLLTDMSARTFTEYERNPDPEHKCWYVAVTRTRQALHLIQPKTQYAYDI